jgi:hypothetical protein
MFRKYTNLSSKSFIIIAIYNTLNKVVNENTVPEININYKINYNRYV